MDDSPREFAREFWSGILRRRVGQIALAVVLAEACIRFLNSLIWYLVVPFLAWLLRGHTESVLFSDRLVFPWQQLFGSFLEFILAVVFVFYVNRWIRGALPTPRTRDEASTTSAKPILTDRPDVYYSITGEPLSPTEQEARDK